MQDDGDDTDEDDTSRTFNFRSPQRFDDRVVNTAIKVHNYYLLREHTI